MHFYFYVLNLLSMQLCNTHKKPIVLDTVLLPCNISTGFHHYRSSSRRHRLTGAIAKAATV